MNFPPTKFLRETVKHCFDQHGIKIVESRTRNTKSRPAYMSWITWHNHFSYNREQAKSLRKVIFTIDKREKTEIDPAWDDVRVIMTLHGYDLHSSMDLSLKRLSGGMLEVCATIS